MDQDTKFAIEQAQDLLRSLATASPTIIGLTLWALGQGTGGRASRETTSTGKLPVQDRIAKVGAGLVASDVLETGGSLIGDVTDLLGDVAGFTLIAEGITGRTVKEILEPISGGNQILPIIGPGGEFQGLPPFQVKR